MGNNTFSNSLLLWLRALVFLRKRPWRSLRVRLSNSADFQLAMASVEDQLFQQKRRRRWWCFYVEFWGNLLSFQRLKNNFAVVSSLFSALASILTCIVNVHCPVFRMRSLGWFLSLPFSVDVLLWQCPHNFWLNANNLKQNWNFEDQSVKVSTKIFWYQNAVFVDPCFMLRFMFLCDKKCVVLIISNKKAAKTCQKCYRHQLLMIIFIKP